MKSIKGPRPFIKLTEEINEQWVRWDRDFGVPTMTDLSVTGQPYASLSVETIDLDRNEAYVAGLNLFDSYAYGRMGPLYWRMMPTITRIQNGLGPCYRIDMQLLISDNPVVPRLAFDALSRDTISIAAE